MLQFMINHGDYIVVGLLVVLITLIMSDYVTFKLIFSALVKYYREKRYGKTYIEIEEAIKDELYGVPSMHNMDLRFSNDLFIYNHVLYSKVLGDMITANVVREVQYLNGPTITYYALNAPTVGEK